MAFRSQFGGSGLDVDRGGVPLAVRLGGAFEVRFRGVGVSLPSNGCSWLTWVGGVPLAVRLGEVFEHVFAFEVHFVEMQ